ncbi:EAL domain-containing response regulator [Vibrio sp. CAU 1672]|uniref:EAL domain-containing response regulator n=1 Tax=Vibrio sp. CAU 1672 TaxID=3032594 RepID=UPI0023DBE918|nr:EAL domain-containing response regulator [Vibrio sp. CAU 1672]MDF2153526.1 EAL domain-containing response regulator [Vibrio sp. CAU 1672]
MTHTINNILIINGQKAVRHTLELCLNNLGYHQLFLAESDVEVRKYIEQDSIDLIFYNRNMPDDKGWSLFEYLASSQFSGAIVLISEEEQDLLSLMLATQYSLGIVGCVPVPVKFDAVQRILAEAAEYVHQAKRALQMALTPEVLAQHLEQGRLIAYFQPQVNLASKEIKGFEVLVRLKNEYGQWLFPDVFLPVAESDPELMLRLTKSVIEQAFAVMHRHRHQLGKMTVSLNISDLVLEQESFPYWLKEVTEHYQLSPESIICEIPEAAISEDRGMLSGQILRLRKMNFRLSLDDFGKGHSSLEQLNALRFDELKIDKLFVLDCLTNSKSAAVVEKSINLAKGLGMDVVAEGIESQKVATYLEFLGCHIGQGYHFSQARNMSELLESLSEVDSF